ncbi:GNAT family N-acetyltransferase [Sandaracinus amylolyticus]|uniref:N-acetyltransferase domain-containing protein n=1 Tax=Sandaracinus amylolyticus TaxID=927083 RepID=A0A0F6YJG4_9BACT|nr:GNAT family N-acetyltransferase [Sandaracinus amylolyticus]AKF07788.1 Hypothetical protein DB32_004937 [Sandaracinus amylolyticus]
MRITIRPAGPGDAADAAELLLRARRGAGDAIPPPAHTDDEVRAWMRTVVIPTREVWLATALDGRSLGLLVLDGAWIDQLYVDADHTRSGIGSQLVALAKSRRPRGLQLWTFESNVRAQRFYEQHGFVVAERTDGAGNEERAPDVRYVWPALR